MPVEKAKSAPSSSKSPSSTPVKAKDDRTSISESERSSGSSAAGLSYTTPDQEKKLRSYSLDNTTAGNNMASKNDREALERQIREQRLEFDERDIAEATAQSARISRIGGGNSSSIRFANRSRTADGSNPTVSYFRTGILGGQTADMAGSRESNSTRTSPNARNMQFVSSLEGLLQSHGNTRITSIEQLEDIMLMEVIRIL